MHSFMNGGNSWRRLVVKLVERAYLDTWKSTFSNRKYEPYIHGECLSQLSYVHCRVSEIFQKIPPLRCFSFSMHLLPFLSFFCPIHVVIRMSFGWSLNLPNKMGEATQQQHIFVSPTHGESTSWTSNVEIHSILEVLDVDTFLYVISSSAFTTSPPSTMELIGLHTLEISPTKTQVWHLHIGFSPNEIHTKRKEETQHLCVLARNVSVWKFMERFRGNTNGENKTPVIAVFWMLPSS